MALCCHDDEKCEKILFGVSCKSKYNDLPEEADASSPNKGAPAIACNFGWTIVPFGDMALDLLGLLTRAFFSEFMCRTVHIEIFFRQHSY